MRKVKIVFWLIVIAFMGVLIYQNRPFFLAQQTLNINLMFDQYSTPQLPVVFFFGLFFLIGWLIASVFNWIERFKSAKNIKKLQQTIQSQQSAIDTMKADVEKLKKTEPEEANFQQSRESRISLETKPDDPSDLSAERAS